jgi:hypothetical protein
MRRLASLIALCAAAAGCAIGTTANRFVPATSPRGIEARVETPAMEITGELLEVRDDGMVVLSSSVTPASGRSRERTAERLLRLVPFRSIARARFHQLPGRFNLADGRPPTTEVRERLRLVSRFPYGMPADVEAALLKASGQTTIGGIQP